MNWILEGFHPPSIWKFPFLAVDKDHNVSHTCFMLLYRSRPSKRDNISITVMFWGNNPNAFIVFSGGCFPFTPLWLLEIIYTQACSLVKDSAIKGAGDQGGNKVFAFLKTRNGWEPQLAYTMVVFYSYIIMSASRGDHFGTFAFFVYILQPNKGCNSGLVSPILLIKESTENRGLRDLGSCLSVWHE